MDWFNAITGFRELPYDETRGRLQVRDQMLCTAHTDRRCAVGVLETPSVAELRARAAGLAKAANPSRVSCIVGDARQLHSLLEYRGALFQVASQFNLLEMVGPSITPEHGVTGYGHDRTQGPACAIAAGAGTIYRNYLAVVGDQIGQRADQQIDCLADLGLALGNADGSRWRMQNGYALCSEKGLAAIDAQLSSASPEHTDRLRALLRVGTHWDVEVTDVTSGEQLVSQAYCSALPVAYTRLSPSSWRRFACLVLEAAYEATVLTALLNRDRTGSNIVLMTMLGGGAFGNDPRWILAAMRRAFEIARDWELDIRVVSYGSTPPQLAELVRCLR